MNYRDVTKDDVGKMVEVCDAGTFKDGYRMALEHVLSTPSDGDFKYLTWAKAKGRLVWWKHARIRTSPLPDGWLPDDWRVLGDEEVCATHDLIVYKNAIKKEFDGRVESPYMFGVMHMYVGKTATWAADRCDHHLCVIRPRWRKATKGDVGKTVYSKDDQNAVLKIIVDADSFGYDAICMSQMLGWCFSKLCDLKVENEGWHVTN
jgi:hypothetical protein